MTYPDKCRTQRAVRQLRPGGASAHDESHTPVIWREHDDTVVGRDEVASAVH
jgi:hypothetical protein